MPDGQHVEEQPRQRTALRARLHSALPDDPQFLRLLLIVVLLFVAFTLARPRVFPTLQNAQSMARQSSELAILTLAILLTMLSGGIDLSIVSTANLSGIVAAFTLTALVPAGATGGEAVGGIIGGVLAALVVGFAGGLFNGFLVAYVGITPILATLGTLTLYQGLATVLSGGASVFGVPAFLFVGNGNAFGIIPVPALIFIVIAILVAIILKWTRYGLKLYMLGTNEKAARFSGIDTTRILLITYASSGLLSAVAGLIILGRNNAAAPDFGSSYILLAILIAVLGGVDPYGGYGEVLGVVLAVVAVQLLSTGLNMVLFQYSGANFFRQFAWGALLLVILVVNYLFTRRQRDEVAGAEE